jgi:hypothetical protein
MYGSQHWTGWVNSLPEGHWPVYRRVLNEATCREFLFAVGGAFATATHAGVWRGTNDMDLYVLPENRQAAISMLEELDLHNIQQTFPYDPSVTHRATDGRVIVELIWGMKNHRAMVDNVWLTRSEWIDIDGLRLRVTPPEEMIWPKLYVLSRERSDWSDILNILYFCGEGLDWRHLLERLGDDTPLLAGVLCVLKWLQPQKVQEFPAWLLKEVGIDTAAPPADETGLRRRAELLNPADWFGPRFSEKTV